MVFCCSWDRGRQDYDDITVEAPDDKERRSSIGDPGEIEITSSKDAQGQVGESKVFQPSLGGVAFQEPSEDSRAEASLEAISPSQAPGQGFPPPATIPATSSACPPGSGAAGEVRRLSEPSLTAPAPSTCANPSADKLPEDILGILMEADKLRATCFPFDAEQLVFELVRRLEKEGKVDILDAVRQTQHYKDIVGQMLEINSTLETLLDDTGWTLQTDKAGMYVWTRPEKGTDLVTVRLAGLVEGPFKNFCSVGKEVDLIKTWMPGVKESKMLAQLDPFSFIGHYKWQQMLFSVREFLIEEKCHVNDDLGYLVCKRGPPEPRKDVTLPAEQKGVVRAGIHNWCSFSQPLGKKDGRSFTFAVAVCNVDLQVPLPTWVANKLSINFGYESFLQLRNNVKGTLEPGSAFAQSFTNPANREYYERVEELEKRCEGKRSAARRELLQTGWIKDTNERRRMFERGEGEVLVPLMPPNAATLPA